MFFLRVFRRRTPRQRIIEVFKNHTAIPQTAQALSEESGLPLDEVDKALTSLNATNNLRRFGIGSIMYYLYVEEA